MRRTKNKNYHSINPVEGSCITITSHPHAPPSQPHSHYTPVAAALPPHSGNAAAAEVEAQHHSVAAGEQADTPDPIRFQLPHGLSTH